LRENNLKAIWQNGGAAINGWLHIPSTWSAELMAHQGWDSLTIDMQHGLMGLETAIQMLQAISTTDTVPMARVPWNEPGVIGRILDAGAYGVICPMVNTREDCEAFVSACRYHPDGFRSLGPTRANLYAGDDYAANANRTVLTFAMIETQTALDNVEAIASVPELDGFYIGPGDLSLSLFGKGKMDNEDPAFLAAVDKIMSAARRHHIVTGIHTASVEYARKMVQRGMQLVTIMSDTALLRSAAKAAVNGMKTEIQTGNAPVAQRSAY
jgi:4-hydroxy-2-oxoheptanedioate aldolase